MGWAGRDINEGTRTPLTPPHHNALENQLPTNERQNSHGSNAVSPAVAGRTPPDPAAASMTAISFRRFCLPSFLLLSLALSVL